MYLLAKFGSHRSYGNGDIKSYFSSYMNTLEKAELSASVRQIERFSESRIQIYNSKVPDTAGRRTRSRRRRRRRTQVTAKRYTFHTNAINQTCTHKSEKWQYIHCLYRRNASFLLVFIFFCTLKNDNNKRLPLMKQAIIKLMY